MKFYIKATIELIRDIETFEFGDRVEEADLPAHILNLMEDDPNEFLFLFPVNYISDIKITSEPNKPQTAE